jgi:hypothetical protein
MLVIGGNGFYGLDGVNGEDGFEGKEKASLRQHLFL